MCFPGIASAFAALFTNLNNHRLGLRNGRQFPIPIPNAIPIPIPIPLEARRELNQIARYRLDFPFLKKEEEDYFSLKYGIRRRLVKEFFNEQIQKLLNPARSAFAQHQSRPDFGQITPLGTVFPNDRELTVLRFVFSGSLPLA
jgi:hypothetical protein